MNIKLLFFIGSGSFLGGVFRYVLSLLIQQKNTTCFPLSTFFVNIFGCFFIGLVYSWSVKGQISEDMRLFLATGILGGFTTFSAFSYETMSLLRQGQTNIAVLYIVASIIIGICATLLGFKLLEWI
jgi:CrcB protein